MKHVFAFPIALLIVLATIAVASRSHRPQHISDTGVRQAEGKTPAPALLQERKPVIRVNGAGRLGVMAPESSSIQRPRQTGVGLIIPDDEPVGRLEMPREGKSDRVWQELVIPD